MRTFEICVFKYINSNPPVFYCTRISMPNSLKKGHVKLDLLTDIDMSLIVEKGIKSGIFHAIYRHAEAETNT